MKIQTSAVPFLLLTLGCATLPAWAQGSGLPHLEKRGAVTQLIVDGKPFLMLAGELHNSSSSSLEYMKTVWPKMAAIPLNTVVTPLSWELVEPVEGRYDYALVDGLLAQAREQHERIVFLWLASWKNGMSSYAPVWVKQDTKRFPRVVDRGSAFEILSPQGTATMDADGKAFAALMSHLREVDARDHTVLMMQIENEVGVLGDTRDHSAEADRAFASAVPGDLTKYLKTHREALNPELRALWSANGEKTSGTWAQVFGDTARADEIFMAWHYARFVQSVTARGKAAYALPMYVNTWLAGEETTPGDYPSGGPQPRVMDVWKAAGTALDIYAPDLYAPDFKAWCQRYHRADNPLFMPETRGGAAGAANVFYAVGEHGALGFSPFGIDDQDDATGELGASYKAIMQVAPLLLDAQTRGGVHGFVLDRDNSSVEFEMNDYTVHVTLDEIFGNHSQQGFGLVIQTGPQEFTGAGKGFRVAITKRDGTRWGIAAVDEGEFVDGKWVAGRRLNGDENDQGNYWRFDPRQLRIEKVTLYKYQ